MKYVSVVAHDGPPIRLVSKRGILASIRSRWSKKHRKCRRRKRRRVQFAVVGTINPRVHDPHRAKLVEIKQHDARADLRRVVPFLIYHVRMIWDRHGDIGAPAGALLSKERWVRQEERARVHIDGPFDVIRQYLMQE